MNSKLGKWRGVEILAIGAWIVGVSLYRVVAGKWMPELPNFSPVMAEALCGAFFLPGVLAYALPLLGVVGSDIALAVTLGYPALSVGAVAGWIALGLAVAMGRWLSLSGRSGSATVLGGVVTSSALFYVATNTASWLALPGYTKTLAGWVQALTVGLPGYLPTWVFFRNSLVSDLVFTGLILATLAIVRTATGKSAAADWQAA